MNNLLPEEIEAHAVEDSIEDRVSGIEKDLLSLKNKVEREMQNLALLLRSARITFGSSAPQTQSSSNGETDKWERIKAKVGGKMAEIIEALRLTETATPTQLRNQTGGASSTVKAAIYKLRDMGLIVKNGERWSLKP